LSGSFFERFKTSSDENSLVTVPHRPHSRDLAPSDLWLFGYVHASLACCVFNDVDGILEAIIEFLNEIQASDLKFVFYTGSNN
jgi:hypothetical protein